MSSAAATSGRTRSTLMTSSAPITAPVNIAPTEMRRRDGVTAGSAGEPGVGRDSGERERENCGCEIRHREPAGHRILRTHRQRQWNDEPVASRLRYGLTNNCGDSDGGEDRQGAGRRRRSEVVAAVRTKARTDPPARERSEEERAERGKGRCDRESWSSGCGEPEEHNVAGHVGDEDTSEERHSSPPPPGPSPRSGGPGPPVDDRCSARVAWKREVGR
jgi:hypothetical protein